jgi:hypothetical protein
VKTLTQKKSTPKDALNFNITLTQKKSTPKDALNFNINKY